MHFAIIQVVSFYRSRQFSEMGVNKKDQTKKETRVQPVLPHWSGSRDFHFACFVHQRVITIQSPQKYPLHIASGRLPLNVCFSIASKMIIYSSMSDLATIWEHCDIKRSVITIQSSLNFMSDITRTLSCVVVSTSFWADHPLYSAMNGLINKVMNNLNELL